MVEDGHGLAGADWRGRVRIVVARTGGFGEDGEVSHGPARKGESRIGGCGEEG